ncbi:MAG: hypothetical protein KIT80_11400 [Chitinophagaceae bacterium]|nr:hypothetical protein [Chitinophagaceae bacterium]MCW5927507.1 hypothetical protein [Chitinophagaceae bacterium]
MKPTNYIQTACLGILLSCVAGSCQKNEADNGLKTELQASFTATPVAGRTNTFLVINNTSGAINTRWDFDKGTGFTMGKMVDTVFFPDAGVYTVRMQAMGKGGIFYDAPAQTIDIPTSDPVAGNLVQGGKFNPGDESKWTIHPISAGVSFEMTNGVMLATGGGWGHAAIYQPIEVLADKKYRLDMVVSGSGATDTWFEVFLGTDVPVANSDYSSGGNRLALNTWAGCGNSPFNGNLATIACEGSLRGTGGEVTFPQSGTIYLFIKTGGANLGISGISIDNVELRGAN